MIPTRLVYRAWHTPGMIWAQVGTRFSSSWEEEYPKGEVVGRKEYLLKNYLCTVFSTTPPFGHPSSQEEGNEVTLVYNSANSTPLPTGEGLGERLVPLK